MPRAREGDNPLAKSTGTDGLIGRFQAGDSQALERMWTHHLPRLREWAHGRLPRFSHNANDTDDLVQDTFVRSLAYLRTLKLPGPHSLISYFNTIILNRIRDYMRQSLRRPVRPLGATDAEERADGGPSPLQELLGQEILERYERALLSLADDDQHLVLAAVELRLSDRRDQP